MRDLKRLGFIQVPDVFLGVHSDWKVTPVTITEIVSNSPADKTGIKVNDVIVAVDGEPVPDYFNMLRFMSGKRPGDEVKLKVNRAGEVFEVLIKLGSRDSLK